MLLNMLCAIYGQVLGVYSFDTPDKIIDCNIYFFKSGNYYIEVNENITSDMNESLVFSYGTFVVNGSVVKLLDKVNNYTMELILDNKELVVKKSFNWLLSKHFTFSGSISNSEPKFITSKFDTLETQLERKNYKRLNKNLFSFDLGTYKNKQGFCLNIQQNNSYKLVFKNIILSEGQWFREGNELSLFDITLKHSFYLLIDNQKLISKFLPGEYKGSLFTKE